MSQGCGCPLTRRNTFCSRKSPPPEDKIAADPTPSDAAVTVAEKEEQHEVKDQVEGRKVVASAGAADVDEVFDVPDSPAASSASSSKSPSPIKTSLEPLPKIGSSLAPLSVDVSSPVKAHADSPGKAANKPLSPSLASPAQDSIVSEVLE